MDYNVVEFVSYMDSQQLLYKYNRRIGTELADDELRGWLNKILTVGDPLGIVVNEEVIAFLLLYCNNEDTLEAYICNVYVDSRYRGMRLSYSLVEKAIGICRDRGFKCINLDVVESNIPALKIYRACGFIVTKRYLNDEEYKLRMTYYL